MNKNYHAYTGLISPLPEYISVNEKDNLISITVRTQGANFASVINLTPEQAESMAIDIIAGLNGATTLPPAPEGGDK